MWLVQRWYLACTKTTFELYKYDIWLVLYLQELQSKIELNKRQHLTCSKTIFDLYKDNMWLVQYLTCTKTIFDLYKNDIWIVQRRYFTCTKTIFTLYKDDIWLVQRRYFTCTLLIGIRLCGARQNETKENPWNWYYQSSGQTYLIYFIKKNNGKWHWKKLYL